MSCNCQARYLKNTEELKAELRKLIDCQEGQIDEIRDLNNWSFASHISQGRLKAARESLDCLEREDYEEFVRLYNESMLEYHVTLEREKNPNLCGYALGHREIYEYVNLWIERITKVEEGDV